jgi:DNA-binding MarR family transcriptional regulator
MLKAAWLRLILLLTVLLSIAGQLTHTGILFEYAYGKQPKYFPYSFFFLKRLHRDNKNLETISVNRVLQLLRAMGLTMNESEIYVYLAKTGPQSIEDLGKALGITKQQLHRILKNLQEKGVIAHNPQMIEVVSATTFEEILEFYLKRSKDKVRKIAENKDELLTMWKDMKFKQT